MLKLKKRIVTVWMVVFAGIAMGQEGELRPPASGQSASTVLTEIQARVDKIQTLTANVEFDRKADKPKKKKNKQKNKNVKPDKPKSDPWLEPEGRVVERGPLEISRGQGARLMLERKKDQELYVANSQSIWKHEITDKEARHIPTNLPVVSTFVSNALKINVFVAMDNDSIKLLGSQTVDGNDCWVLEGKSPSKLSLLGIESTKLRIYIGKTDGIPRIISVPSEKDTVIRLRNIQLNGNISPSRFQYTPPSDVKTKNILGF